MNEILRKILIFSLLINAIVFAQSVLKYQIIDDGTSLSIGTAVKVDASGNITACGDNDPDVVGVIVSKENDGVNRYYVISSGDVALAPLPNTLLAGDKLTTAAGGGIRKAALGEIVVGIALEDGDGNALTNERLILTLGYASPSNFISNQYASAQSANFWIDKTGRVGHLVVDSSAVVNESGGNYDFRVEGDTDPNLLFTDASTDFVGIGTNVPLQKLDLDGALRLRQKINIASASDTSGVIWVKQAGVAPDTMMFWDDENHIWLAVCPPRANPKCQVYGGSNTDCNPGPIPVPFANETRVDNGFTHNNALNPSRVYIGQDGYYKITYQIAFNNTINNRVDMHTYVRLNGITNLGGDGYCYMRDNTNAPREVCNGVVYLVNLANGDYVEIVAERYSGANGNTFAIDPQCWFMVERENVGEGAGGGAGGGPQWADAGAFLYPINAGRNIRPNVSGTVGEAAGRWNNIYSVDGNFSNDLTISGGINDGMNFGTAGYVLKTDGTGDIYWYQDSAGGRFDQLRAGGNPWLTDSVTFVAGTNVTLTQVGDSITIASSTNWDTLGAFQDTLDRDFLRMRTDGNPWLYDSLTIVSGSNISIIQAGDSATIDAIMDFDTLGAYRDTLDRDFQRIRAEANPWLPDSLTIVAGSNISLNQTGDTLTISSSGTPGGNFQRLRSDANPWLYDSTTFISGTNITLTQVGNQITITSTGASQWVDGGAYLQPINVNRDIIPNLSGNVGQSANRWDSLYSVAGNFSGSVAITNNLVVSGNVTISGGLNDGVSFGTTGYCLKTDGIGDIYWYSDSVGGSFDRLRSDGNSWLPDSVTLVSGTNITLTQTGDSITITSSTNWDTLGAYRDTLDRDFIRLRADGNPWLPDSATFVSGTNITLTQVGDSITIVAAGNVSGTGTATQVAFWSAADTISSSSNLYWDNTNSRLGIGTTTPNQNLSIAGSMGIIEGGVFPSFYTIFRGSDQTADIAYYLPPAQGATNTFLMNDGSGNLSWSNPVPEVVTILAGDNLQWRNMPAALTEIFNATIHRTMVDLSNATQARLTVGVGRAGFATAELRGQYSTDGATWFYLDGTSGPSVPINAVGLQVSSWVNLDAGAQADVYIRIVGINGNGAADPRFGLITIQFR